MGSSEQVVKPATRVVGFFLPKGHGRRTHYGSAKYLFNGRTPYLSRHSLSTSICRANKPRTSLATKSFFSVFNGLRKRVRRRFFPCARDRLYLLCSGLRFPVGPRNLWCGGKDRCTPDG